MAIKKQQTKPAQQQQHKKLSEMDHQEPQYELAESESDADSDMQSEEQEVPVRYTGFTFEANSNWQPDRINSNFPPHRFFEQYIAQRMPVIVKGVDKDSALFNKFLNKKNLFDGIDALAKSVGPDAVVEVETRDVSGNENFGTGRARRMVQFADFVDAVKKGDTSMYLSTQYSNGDADEEDEEDEEYHGSHGHGHVHGEDCDHDHEHRDDDEDSDDEDEDENGDEEDEDEDEDVDMNEVSNEEDYSSEDDQDFDQNAEASGHIHGEDCNHSHHAHDLEDDANPSNQQIDLLEMFNEYCKAPLPHVISDIPLRPKLIPTLIPQQINLWMGAAPPEGVSSGLHHDFADNLYILLQGTKRVTLIPPNAAPELELFGEDDLQVVHENGYSGDVARWKLKVSTKALKDGLKENAEGKEVDLEALRKDVEEAKNHVDLIEEEEVEEYDNSDDDSDDDFDDISVEEEEDEDDGDISDEEKEFLFGKAVKDDEDEDMEIDQAELDNLKLQDDYEEEDEDFEEDSPPMSFSQISPEELHDKNGAFNDIPKVTFDLKEGEMLYIPASWFHEIQSAPANSKAAGPHVAFNYWFHPPNALDAKDYETPYKTDYWSEHWSVVEKLINEADTPEVLNNSADAWTKLGRDEEGNFTRVIDDSKKVEDEVREFEDYESVPRALKLAFKWPGSWFMRNKDGKFIGRAKKATFPKGV
ncbi:hypothetical protein HDU77_007931 [Chytriomyces hyalinus]|nr:hypothetical protein HDU77_007931 [Chytriomyces hyalinus]